jgi:hypothetical protein
VGLDGRLIARRRRPAYRRGRQTAIAPALACRAWTLLRLGRHALRTEAQAKPIETKFMGGSLRQWE